MAKKMGRPRKRPEAMPRKISIRVTEATYQKMNQIAMSRNAGTISDYWRYVLEYAVNNLSQITNNAGAAIPGAPIDDPNKKTP